MGEVLHIEDALNEKGVYVSTTSGVSMYPMLRNRRDTIIVKPPTAPLKKYDVPLYRRGDDYVLHRIIGKDDKGYIICGDNCINKEYGITENQIIGVLVGFYRDGNEVNMDKVISIVRADAAPVKRMVQVARDGGMAVDATCGRKTKCVLVMDSGHIVLSALQPETIENRVTDNPSAGGKEDD